MSAWLMIGGARLQSADQKVIKATQFEEWRDAGALLTSAEQQAKTLRAETEQYARELYDQAVIQGREQGRGEYAAMLAELAARAESSFVGLEGRIVNTVMNALSQILGELDRELVVNRLLQRALHAARANKSLRLRVSAADYDEVNRQLQDMLSQYPTVEFIDVLKDPRAPVGTCILESEMGTIDASIDTQLAAVRRGLLAAFVGRRPLDSSGDRQAT